MAALEIDPLVQVGESANCTYWHEQGVTPGMSYVWAEVLTNALRRTKSGWKACAPRHHVYLFQHRPGRGNPELARFTLKGGQLTSRRLTMAARRHLTERSEP